MENLFNVEGLSTLEVEAKLDAIRRSPGGLDKIGQQMLSLLKRDLLYEGRTRQLFQVHKLNLGEEALYDADIRVPAYALSVEGIPFKAEIRSDRVRIDTSPIGTRQVIRWNESNFRKFDIINRAADRAKADVMEKEDIRAIAVINAASTGFNAAIPNASAALEIPNVVKSIVTLRQNREIASKVFLAPLRTGDIMLWNISLTGGSGVGIYSPQTQEALQKAGRLGMVWGTELLESDRVPTNRVYVLAPPEYLGVFAVRTDIEAETLKDPNQFADVVSFWEDVGYVIRFSNGIQRIDLPGAATNSAATGEFGVKMGPGLS